MKETLEVGEAQVSEGTNRPKPDSGHLRSDAVSLDVPVKVHGSRVVEVIRGTTPHTEPFEEQTSTMIVFPLGGVLKMTTPVNVGQAIVLTNLKTRQDAICRVIKVRTNPNLNSYVEVEFSHPQPGYWGVHFPSDGPETPKKAASPAASASSAPTAIASVPASPAISKPAPKIEVKERKAVLDAPVAPPAPPAPPRAAKLLDLAADVVVPKAQAHVETEKGVRPAVPPSQAAVETPAVAPAASSASFSLEQLRVDTSTTAGELPSSKEKAEGAETGELEAEGRAGSPATDEPSSEQETRTFGRFAASAGPGGEPAARPAFGSGLEYTPIGAAAEKGQAEGKNWVLIVACVVLLFAAAGGGGFYFLHKQPAARSVVATAPAAPELPLPANAVPKSTLTPAAPVQQTRAAATVTSTPPAAPPVVRARGPESDKGSKLAPNGPIQSPIQSAVQSPVPSNGPAPTKQKTTTAVPDMFGALNAHPTTSVRDNAGESEAAPAIDSGALPGSEGVALPSGETAPANLAPPPQPAPEGPVPVGGDVKAPQSISSVAPVYPEIARQAGIQGNVVVRVVIDKAGNVTEARAISGPVLLRDAAVNALRQRKYAPSKLDGHPISVEMLVTIQFRR